MKFTVERWLDGSPEEVWALLLDPARTGREMSCELRLLHERKAGRWGAGARWEATTVLPAGKLVVEVEILEAKPGSRLVYRVVAGLPVLRHRAVIALSSVYGGTRLRWEVDADFAQSAIESLARWHFEARTERGLALLAQLFRDDRRKAYAAEPCAAMG